MLQQLEIGQFVDFIKLSERGSSGVNPPQTSDTAQWFCIVSNVGQHAKVEAELYSSGYRSFAPKIRKWRSHARVRTAVERPLLGRYLFVEIDHPRTRTHITRQSFGAVRAVKGVESIVGSLGTPTPFPARWVEGFMCRYLAGEWDFVRQEPVYYQENGRAKVRVNAGYSVGDRIRIVEGEFEEMLATVTGVKGKRVDIKLLGTNKYTRLNDVSVRAA